MSWCYSPINILHRLENHNMQSTPYKNSTLEEGQYMNKDNTGTLWETDNNQSIVYENSHEIDNSNKQETQTHQESSGQTLEARRDELTGIENSQNEWQHKLCWLLCGILYWLLCRIYWRLLFRLVKNRRSITSLARFLKIF